MNPNDAFLKALGTGFFLVAIVLTVKFWDFLTGPDCRRQAAFWIEALKDLFRR